MDPITEPARPKEAAHDAVEVELVKIDWTISGTSGDPKWLEIV